MKHLRDTHLIDPASDYVPDVPEPGDTVRVYQSSDSNYYIIGQVLDYDDETCEYLIMFLDRFNETCTMEETWELVETYDINED